MIWYKMAITEIFVLLTLFIVIARADDSICTKTAIESIESPGLMGGWTNHTVSDLPIELNSKISKYTDDALTKWNDISNDLRVFRPVKAEREGGPKFLSVYTQLVAGTNYCITFLAEPYQCRSGDSKNDICTSGAVECEFQAYELLPYMLRGAPLEATIKEVKCDI